MFERKIFWLVVAIRIAVLIGIVVIFGADRLLWSDSFVYRDLAQSIASGMRYTDSLRTPLYPIVLSLFVGWGAWGLATIVAVQAFLAALTSVFIFRIARWFVRPYPAAAAAVLFAAEPLSILLGALILPETFLLFFLVLFCYWFMRGYREERSLFLAYSAIALGCAILVKPVALYLWVIPVAFLLYAKHTRQALVYGGLIFALVLPWMVHNKLVFNTFAVTTHDTVSVCGYLLTSVFASEFGKDPSNMDVAIFPPKFLDAQARCTSSSMGIRIAMFEYPASFIKTMMLSSAAFLTNEGYGAFFQKAPEESIKAHHNYLTPVVFADVQWRRNIVGAARELSVPELLAVLGGKLFWVIVCLLAFMGMYSALRDFDMRPYALFLILVLLYFIGITVLSTAFGVGARLRYPITPILFVFAVLCLVRRYKFV
ncbi:MAG: glycosyltransferase family 39 protein [Patescibacteria group bacterium]